MAESTGESLVDAVSDENMLLIEYAAAQHAPLMKICQVAAEMVVALAPEKVCTLHETHDRKHPCLVQKLIKVMDTAGREVFIRQEEALAAGVLRKVEG